MTTLKTFLLIALVSAAHADTSTNSLDQVVSLAQDIFNNFTSYWNIETPSSDTVRRTLSNISETVAARMGDVVRHIQTEIQAHSGQASEALQSASANLNRSIAELQSPENKRRVEELRSGISSGLQTLAQEASRVKNAVAEDTQGLRSEAHNVWIETLRTAQQLGERVQSAIQEHQAAHDKQ